MRLSEIKVAADGAFAELRARVACERDPADPDRFAPFTRWHRYPAACAPRLRPDNGDPWVATLLLAAMAQRERLLVPARCRITAPALLVTVDPPCRTISASGLQPGTPFTISTSSPCYGGSSLSGPHVPANGTVVLGATCGNCAIGCPGRAFTTIEATVKGTAAKSGKPFEKRKQVKHVACVPL